MCDEDFDTDFDTDTDSDQDLSKDYEDMGEHEAAEWTSDDD